MDREPTTGPPARPSGPSEPGPRRPGIGELVVALLLIALVAAGIYLAAPYLTRTRVETMVRAAGAWGPIVLVGVQAAQIVAAPIPGIFVPLVAGILYGPVLGPVVTAVGTFLGSTAAYWIGRKAGRTLIERWMGGEALERSKRLIAGRRWIALVLLFLVPFSPADALCFAAGILAMPWRRFVAAVMLGRVPKDALLAVGWALGWALLR